MFSKSIIFFADYLLIFNIVNVARCSMYKYMTVFGCCKEFLVGKPAMLKSKICVSTLFLLTTEERLQQSPALLKWIIF
jgi:hypothetical protein